MNPSGFCKCGCGEKTVVSTYSHRGLGRVRGKPIDYVHGHNARDRRIEKRWVEEDRGHDTLCWIWQLAINPVTGYGIDGSEGGSRTAHRRVYEDRRGLIPEGFELDHLCRVRGCVNPDHLEPVTKHENLRRAGLLKLADEEVEEIRVWLSLGYQGKDIARAYGVSRANVSMIKNNKTRKVAA